MSEDSGLSAFLNRLNPGSSARVPYVSAQYPIRWRALGAAIVGSFIATISNGIVDIFAAIGTAWTELLSGATEFIAGRDPFTRVGVPIFGTGKDGLLDVLFGPLIAGITGAYDIALADYGVLALPMAVGITVGSLWVVMRTVTWLNGGDDL